MSVIAAYNPYMTKPTVALWASPENAVSDDARVIFGIFDALANSWTSSATGQAQMAEPQAALFRLYEECRADNWDGEGAKAIRMLALFEAQRLLTILSGVWPIPEFLPEPSGAIAFQWYISHDRIFVCSVAGKGDIEFAGLFGEGNETHGKALFTDTLPRVIETHLRDFFAK